MTLKADSLLPSRLVSKDPPTLPALDHPTAVVYLDESGNPKSGRFFGIGCLKVTDGPALTRAMWGCRKALCFTDELHWARLDKGAALRNNALEMATAAIDVFFQLSGASFCCSLFDRQDGDPMKGHKDAWSAYEAFAVEALSRSIAPGEVATVLADHTDTPAHVRFEDGVKVGVNQRKGGLAVATVTRMHSHGIDGLQVVDLLLGAAMFDFRRGRLRTGESASQKDAVCAHLLSRCGIPSFRPHGQDIDGKVRVEMRRPRPTRRGRRGGDQS